MTRDKNGRFVAGNGGGPGRPKRDIEHKYLDITLANCSQSEWREIVKKAVQQAVRGDAVARKWLADYIIGTPVQRSEVSGRDGEPLQNNVTIYIPDNGR